METFLGIMIPFLGTTLGAVCVFFMKKSLGNLVQRAFAGFAAGVLCFAFAEYLLWTAGCFWPNTSPASPTFWCDMLLTLAILGLLPATRKAVDA